MVPHLDAEEIVDLPLEERGRMMKGAQRGDRRAIAGQMGHGLQEPVLARMREEVVQLEAPRIRAAVHGHHEPEIRALILAQDLGQPERVAGADPAGDLAPANDADVAEAPSQPATQAFGERGQVGHGATISTTCVRSASSGRGTVRPSTTRTAAQRTSGARPARCVSPTATPAGGPP